MTTILIGLDDTDNATSPGTGRLARDLLAEAGRRGLGPGDVTRHQFLLDDRIAYTSHNSGACLALPDGGSVASASFAFDFVAARAAPGSDPGVCLAARGSVGAEVMRFGRRAALEVLDMDEAHDLADRAGLLLRGLGGSCLGVIGALASLGQRAEGHSGRFIDLPGLRDLPARVGAAALEGLGIQVEHAPGRQVTADDEYETFGWIRPRLVDSRPVLPVQWSDHDHAWIPIDRKRSRPLE